MMRRQIRASGKASSCRHLPERPAENYIGKDGMLYNDVQERKLQLHLTSGATHTVTDKALGTYQVATFAETDIPIASLTMQVEDTSTGR